MLPSTDLEKKGSGTSSWSDWTVSLEGTKFEILVEAVPVFHIFDIVESCHTMDGPGPTAPGEIFVNFFLDRNCNVLYSISNHFGR